MKTPYDRLVKLFTNCTGLMTKITTMPIYGKNPLNIFFSGTKGQWPWDLVCSIRDLGPTRIRTNDESRLTLTFFMARSNLIPNAFIWEQS